MNQYEELARRVALEQGVPPDLYAALVGRESGFDPQAYSPAGAIGLAQLMPGTAGDLGVIDPWNPEQNLTGGAQYLKQMLDRYNGDTRLALAAYNAGPGAVDKYGGVPPYEETRKYVAALEGAGGNSMMNPQYSGNPYAVPTQPDPVQQRMEMLRQSQQQQSGPLGISPQQWMQMGLGILATPTGTGSPLMGAARGAMQGAAMAPHQLTALEMLKAENELYDLEASRQERQMKRIQMERTIEGRKKLAEKYPQYAQEIMSGMFDSQMGKLMFPDPTTNQRDYQFLRGMGLDQNQALDKSFSSGINIDMGTNLGQEKWYEQNAKAASEEIAGFRDRMSANREGIDAVDQMQYFMDQPDFQSGDFSTAAREGMSNIANAMGLPFSFLSADQQTFKSQSQRMVNTILNKAKGPQTEGDAIRALQTLPGLGQKPEANKQIASYLKGRMELDSYFSDKLAGVRMMDNYQGALTAQRDLMKQYDNAQASVVIREGGKRVGMIHFDDYANTRMDQGVPYDVIIEDWMDAVARARRGDYGGF